MIYKEVYRSIHLIMRVAATATWLALHDDGTGATAPAATEREFRRHIDCGILIHSFARARCADCGHDFLAAHSCKCRGICPSCTTRRMVEMAANLARALRRRNWQRTTSSISAWRGGQDESSLVTGQLVPTVTQEENFRSERGHLLGQRASRSGF